MPGEPQTVGVKEFAGDEVAGAKTCWSSIDVSNHGTCLKRQPGSVELARMSAKALCLLEPWLGEEGPFVQNDDERLERDIDTAPFSFSWDYPALAARVLPNWQLSERPMPLPTNLGPDYHLFELTRKPVPPAGA